MVALPVHPQPRELDSLTGLVTNFTLQYTHARRAQDMGLRESGVDNVGAAIMCGEISWDFHDHRNAVKYFRTAALALNQQGCRTLTAAHVACCLGSCAVELHDWSEAKKQLAHATATLESIPLGARLRWCL